MKNNQKTLKVEKVDLLDPGVEPTDNQMKQLMSDVSMEVAARMFDARQKLRSTLESQIKSIITSHGEKHPVMHYP